MRTLSITTASLLICGAQLVQAGAVCVVAKKLGNSLDIEWMAAPDQSAHSALQLVKDRLIERGYQDKYHGLHPQASSELSHGYGAIIKTEYETRIGRQRTSYGCGFSEFSKQHARDLALYNLRNYSWGWNPEFGYQVMEDFRF